MAYIYRTELASGMRRGTDQPLTAEERRERLAALRLRAGTLRGKWKLDLEKELAKFEEGIENLKKQAEEHHEEVKEMLTELGESVGDLKDKAGKDCMVFKALAECEIPARSLEEPAPKRLRQLRVMVRHAHNEIQTLQEEIKKESAMQLKELRSGSQVAATAAASMYADITGIDLKDPKLDATAALRMLDEYTENEHKMVRDLRKQLRMLARQQSKDKTAVGVGQGGWLSRMHPATQSVQFYNQIWGGSGRVQYNRGILFRRRCTRPDLPKVWGVELHGVCGEGA
jgi:hypothetical protein